MKNGQQNIVKVVKSNCIAYFSEQRLQALVRRLRCVCDDSSQSRNIRLSIRQRLSLLRSYNLIMSTVLATFWIQDRSLANKMLSNDEVTLIYFQWFSFSVPSKWGGGWG